MIKFPSMVGKCPMSQPIATAYVGVGSNTGNRPSYILRALRMLDQTKGLRILSVSPLYQSEPVGGPPQPYYLNAVAKIRTALKPSALLRSLQRVERRCGRKRLIRWGPRTLDLDLLTYGNRTIRKSHLQIPHPRYHMRRFVLVPFCDVSAGFVHPVYRRKNSRLLRELTPTGQRVTIWKRWKKSPFYQSKKRNPRKLPSPR